MTRERVVNSDIQEAAPSADVAELDINLQIRIARPSDRLDEVVAFYRDGIGMPVIYQFHDHGGYSGVMLVIPDERIHLEFTHAAAEARARHRRKTTCWFCIFQTRKVSGML